MPCGGCGGSNTQPLSSGSHGYEVTWTDGDGTHFELYGSFVPADRRARETGGTVRDATGPDED